MRSFFAVLMVMVMLLGGAGCARAQEESALVGRKAPDFTLARLGGTQAVLSEIIKDKKAILFFFATWCPHCREQIEVLEARKAEFEAKNIALVIVDIGEDKGVVGKFMARHKITYDVLMDTNSFVAQAYQVLGIPTLVFIGADGKVRYVEYGLPDNYEEILK